MPLRGEPQVLVPDHVNVQQRFDAARRSIGAPFRGKPAAAVGVVVVLPAHGRFFAVKKHQPHAVFEGACGEHASQRKKKGRGGAAIVGADEVQPGPVKGVVMPGHHDDAVSFPRQFRNDVFHGDAALGGPGDKVVLHHLQAQRPQFAGDHFLLPLLRRASGGPRTQRHQALDPLQSTLSGFLKACRRRLRGATRAGKYED